MNKNKVKCKYSNCKKEAFFNQAFDLINDDDKAVELEFCKYHYLIVMGGHFKVKIHTTPEILPTKKEPKGTPKKTDFELIGPTKEIEVIEQVIAAREMIREEKTKP